mgnify:FL=1
MPTYDYRCTECDREVEVMHSIHGSGPETCEHCGGAMRKALSPPAIHFKGSGWAKKDAAAATSKKAKPKASATTTTDGAKGDDKAPASGNAKKESGASSESTSGPETKSASTTGSTTD